MSASQKRPIRMVVVPEPDPRVRAVLATTDKTSPMMEGKRKTRPFVCGVCENPIVAGVLRAQVRGIIFHCWKCGAYNEM